MDSPQAATLNDSSDITNLILTPLYIFGYWYALGLIFMFVLSIMWISEGKIEEVRIKDVENYFIWSLSGPFAGVALLFIMMLSLTKSFRQLYVENRNKVLWRSKTSKSKAVLFGSKDDDDD